VFIVKYTYSILCKSVVISVKLYNGDILMEIYDDDDNNNNNRLVIIVDFKKVC
jgi:hypothetical protein